MRSCPVFRSDAHLGHRELREFHRGRDIASWESPDRAVAIERALRATGRFVLREAEAFGSEPILAVHDGELVEVVTRAWPDAVEAGEVDGSRPLLPDTFRLPGIGPEPPELPDGAHRRLGAFCFDTATPIVAGTAAAARAAVDVALSAARSVVEGEPLAYGLCRPPGHHAGRTVIGGYCYFNNAAIVAEWLRSEAGFRKVALLDVDYHHGNGTQQIFWERDDVLVVSIHGDPDRAYPYWSGRSSERGAGAGEGTTRNFPLPANAGLEAYAAALEAALETIAAFAPNAPLVVSAGFDTFEGDPIADFTLRTDDYRLIGTMIAEACSPVIVLQEGGYAVEALGENVVTFLDGLRDGVGRG